MTRWTPLPVYLPNASLTHRPNSSVDSRSNYALGTIPFQGWETDQSGPFNRGKHSPPKEVRDGPRLRNSRVRQERPPSRYQKKFGSLVNDPASWRGGSDFGASRRIRFSAPPPKQFTPGGISGRPLTARDFHRLPAPGRGQPPPLDVQGGEAPAICRRTTPGGPFSTDQRWESFEFHHHMDDNRATPNAHMNHFTGHRKEPSKHRRNSTTSVQRRVEDDPRRRFQSAVFDVMTANKVINAFGGGSAFSGSLFSRSAASLAMSEAPAPAALLLATEPALFDRAPEGEPPADRHPLDAKSSLQTPVLPSPAKTLQTASLSGGGGRPVSRPVAGHPKAPGTGSSPSIFAGVDLLAGIDFGELEKQNAR